MENPIPSTNNAALAPATVFISAPPVLTPTVGPALLAAVGGMLAVVLVLIVGAKLAVIVELLYGVGVANARVGDMELLVMGRDGNVTGEGDVIIRVKQP